MLKMVQISFIFILTCFLHNSNEFVRVRIPRVRIPIRIPPVRIPPVRIPPVRVPPVRIPPVRVPPVRIPPVRIPPVRIPPVRIPPIPTPRIPPVRVRRIVREVGKGLEEAGKGIVKGFNILTQGCCGLHPSYCDNRKEFERRQKEIKTKSDQMDKDWVIVKKKMAQMKTININNQVVYRQVRRVTLASTLTVQTLDPKILEKMNKVTNELKKALREKNQTVMNYGINDIAKELEKTEDRPKTELLDATGIGGFSQTEGYIKMTADMFKLVKLDGVANFLTEDVLGFMYKAKVGISKLFGFHHLENLAKNNEVLKYVFGALKFYNDYLNVFGNVFKVMELFGKFTAWITDLATCNKRKDEMATAIKDLRAQHTKINTAYNNLQNTKKTVDDNLKTILAETYSDGLLTNLVEAEKIAIHSSSNSKQMQTSVKRIQNYRNNIKKSNLDGVINLQKELIYGVGNISYNAECYQRKLATYKNVADNCRLGKASLETLFWEALQSFRTNSDECKSESGLPYTTLGDVQKYVKKKAEKLKFEFDCLLNSGMKLSVVCSHLRNGYTLDQAASQAEVNTTIAQIYKSSCPIITLTPYDKKVICELKSYKSFNDIKTLYTGIDATKVQTAFDTCF